MKLINCLYIFLLQSLSWGCIKTMDTSGSSAFNIVNAINGNNSILTNFQPIGPKGIFASPLQYYASANQIGYGSSWESGSYADSVSLSLFQYPDTGSIVWRGTFNFQRGSIHTLFLSGDTTSVDTLLSTDLIPYYPVSDSVAGIRIVNLIWGSQPLSVNLAGNLPTQTEFSPIGYRQISGFNQYSANSTAGGSYSFEIRDQASDSLLTTYQWSYTLFKNQTLVIIGSENVNLPQPIQVVAMNNF